MYSIHNRGRFISTLKNNIYKNVTAVSKKLYIDKLDNIVNKYNNTFHRTIKMKLVDVKNNIYIYIDFYKKSNDKDPRFKVGDHTRILKYKKIFAKAYNPNFYN